MTTRSPSLLRRCPASCREKGEAVQRGRSVRGAALLGAGGMLAQDGGGQAPRTVWPCGREVFLQTQALRLLHLSSAILAATGAETVARSSGLFWPADNIPSPRPKRLAQHIAACCTSLRRVSIRPGKGTE